MKISKSELNEFAAEVWSDATEDFLNNPDIVILTTEEVENITGVMYEQQLFMAKVAETQPDYFNAVWQSVVEEVLNDA